MMKRFIQLLTMVLATVTLSSCHDRDIVDRKDFDHTLPDIQALNYTREADGVRLSWTIPSDISPAFRRPLEVSIQKVEGDIYREVITVHGENTVSHVITVNPDQTCRFVVKLAGYLLDDVREPGKPDRVFSGGQVVEIQ